MLALSDPNQYQEPQITAIVPTFATPLCGEDSVGDAALFMGQRGGLANLGWDDRFDSHVLGHLPPLIPASCGPPSPSMDDLDRYIHESGSDREDTPPPPGPQPGPTSPEEVIAAPPTPPPPLPLPSSPPVPVAATESPTVQTTEVANPRDEQQQQQETASKNGMSDRAPVSRKRSRAVREAADLLEYTRQMRKDRLLGRWVTCNGEFAGDPEREATAMAWAESERSRMEAEEAEDDALSGEWSNGGRVRRHRNSRPVRRFEPIIKNKNKRLKHDYEEEDIISGDSDAGDAYDDSDDQCHICGDGGELVLCDDELCPRAYHMACLGDRAPPDDESIEWLCPVCSLDDGVDDDGGEYEHDDRVAAEDEEKEVRDVAALKRDAAKHEAMAEKEFNDMIEHVHAVMNQTPPCKDLDVLEEELRIYNPFAIDELLRHARAEGLVWTARLEEFLRIMEEGNGDDDDDEGGIDMSLNADEEQLKHFKQTVERMPSATAWGASHRRGMELIVRYLEHRKEEKSYGPGEFPRHLVLAESLRSCEGFFPADRIEAEALAEAAMALAFDTAIEARKDAVARLLRPCPSLIPDVPQDQKTGGGKSAKTNATNGGASFSNNSNNGTLVMTTPAISSLPKPPPTVATRMIKKTLHAQAQPSGNTDTGLPGGGDAFLLTKGKLLPPPSGKGGCWPDARSGTVGLAIKEAILACDGNADTFVDTYVSWALTRPGKGGDSNVWAYACLRLKNVVTVDAKSVTLAPIPSGHLPKVFPTAKKSSKRVGNLFKNARVRILEAYDGATDSFSWCGDWRGMQKANYFRSANAKSDKTAPKTKRVPVIDSRRLVEIFKPVLKTMSTTTTTTTTPAATEPEEQMVAVRFKSAAAAAKEALENPNVGRPSRPIPEPPLSDPILSDGGSVAGLAPRDIAEFAAASGMCAVVPSDAYDGEVDSNWVLASEVPHETVDQTTPPPPPPTAASDAAAEPPQANGTAKEAGEEAEGPVKDAEKKKKGRRGKLTAKSAQESRKRAQKRLRDIKDKAQRTHRQSKRAKTKRAATSKAQTEPEPEDEGVTESEGQVKRKADEVEGGGGAGKKTWTKRKKQRTEETQLLAELKKPTVKATKALAALKKAAAHQATAPDWFAGTSLGSAVQSLDPDSDPDTLLSGLHALAQIDPEAADQTYSMLDRLILSSLSIEQIRATSKLVRELLKSDRLETLSKLWIFCKDLAGSQVFQLLVLVALRLHRPQPIGAGGCFANDEPAAGGADQATAADQADPGFDDFDMFDGMEDDDIDASPNAGAAGGPVGLEVTPMGAAVLESIVQKSKGRGMDKVLEMCETRMFQWLVEAADKGADALLAELAERCSSPQKVLVGVLGLAWYTMYPTTKA